MVDEQQPEIPKLPAKLPKMLALYMEKAPPPLVYVYECQNCPWFGKDKKSCAIVDGEIKPTAWCILWIPNPSSGLPFTWLLKKFQDEQKKQE